MSPLKSKQTEAMRSTEAAQPSANGIPSIVRFVLSWSVRSFTNPSCVWRDDLSWAGNAGEFLMNRPIAIAIVVALALTTIVKVLAPSETAANTAIAKTQILTSAFTQPDMTWLVGP